MNTTQAEPSITTRTTLWWVPLAWAGLVFLLIIGLMYDTVASMVSIWERSSTFTHGYFVLPIFLWLVWRKRAYLATLLSSPDWLAIPFLLGGGLLWLLSGLAGIQVGQHVAVVLIIIFSFWAVVGRNIAMSLRFPLAFLFFLAPVGEELVPMLMNITADFTVSAIRLTGIPIYREGLFFSLPTGNWSVVEACSGIRYLIASMTLGTLYAYLNYDSGQRRLLFILMSAIVPIVANGIRAFLIVMIGHHSDMKLATGVDHLVYGWLFFGVVMFFLFSLGALFSEPQQSTPPDSTNIPRNVDAVKGGPAAIKHEVHAAFSQRSASSGRFASYALLAALCVATWPAWVMAMNWSSDSSRDLNLAKLESILPGGQANMTESNDVTINDNAWHPLISGFDAHLQSTMEEPQLPAVKAQAFVYLSQQQGKEMISSSNVLVRSEDPKFRIMQKRLVTIGSSETAEWTLEQSVIASSPADLLVWRWYAVGDDVTTSPVLAKFLEARNKLLFRPSHSVIYLLSTSADHPGAQKAMQLAAVSILSK